MGDAAVYDLAAVVAERDALKAENDRLKAACAVKDAALRAATTLVRDCIPSGPDLHNACAALEAALSDTAGRNYIDATGAVETMALPEVADGNAWVDDTPLPAAWVGKSVLIVVKP